MKSFQSQNCNGRKTSLVYLERDGEVSDSPSHEEAARRERRQDPHVMRPHRIYTLFRNLAVALPSVLLAVLGHPLARLESMLVFAAAVVLALVFPVRQDEPIKGGAKVFVGIFGSLGLMVVVIWVFLGCLVLADALFSRAVETNCATYSEFTRHRIARKLHVGAMIPPEACEIHFKGFGGGVMMGWGRWAEFSCTTTESDFLKFASARGYGLATNRFVNVNQAANPTVANREWGNTAWSNLPEPKRYLTYENIRGNGGGITLVFDPGTEILRGHYSSN